MTGDPNGKGMFSGQVLANADLADGGIYSVRIELIDLHDDNRIIMYYHDFGIQTEKGFFFTRIGECRFGHRQ